MHVVKQTEEFIVLQSKEGSCFKVGIEEFPVVQALLENALGKTDKAIQITLNFKNK